LLRIWWLRAWVADELGEKHERRFAPKRKPCRGNKGNSSRGTKKAIH